VAMALMAGCDMDCNGDIYPREAKKAHAAGLLEERQVNLNVYNNLLARFKLGEFDPVESVRYNGERYAFAASVETDEHRALADEAASRAVVLLKNEDGILPLNARRIRRIAVVGELADACFLGNYCGKPKEKNRISVYTGIADYLYVHNPRAEVSLVTSFGENGAIRAEDREKIESADVVLVVCADDHDDSSEGHDRESLRLARSQAEIARNAAAINPDTIVFLQTANVVELGVFKDAVKAIFWSSHNGQGQGVGVANQLFGEVNPSGKLTFTWYAKEEELPGIRQYGLKEYATIRSSRSGKQYDTKDSGGDYHGEIISKIRPLMEKDMPLVLLGPGFEKELLADDGKQRDPQLFSKVFVYHTGQSGMQGVNELMKKGMGSDLLRQSRIGVEMEAVEKVMTEIGKNGLATYGTAQVNEACASGAVETLLILDSKLRDGDYDTMIRNTESQKGNVIVVSEQHDAGKQLASLGGFAALLRYKIG